MEINIVDHLKLRIRELELKQKLIELDLKEANEALNIALKEMQREKGWE